MLLFCPDFIDDFKLDEDYQEINDIENYE